MDRQIEYLNSKCNVCGRAPMLLKMGVARCTVKGCDRILCEVCLYNRKFIPQELLELYNKEDDTRTVPCPKGVRCGTQELKLVIRPKDAGGNP
jgi:hypothetical protein